MVGRGAADYSLYGKKYVSRFPVRFCLGILMESFRLLFPPGNHDLGSFCLRSSSRSLFRILGHADSFRIQAYPPSTGNPACFLHSKRRIFQTQLMRRTCLDRHSERLVGLCGLDPFLDLHRVPMGAFSFKPVAASAAVSDL